MTGPDLSDSTTPAPSGAESWPSASTQRSEPGTAYATRKDCSGLDKESTRRETARRDRAVPSALAQTGPATSAGARGPSKISQLAKVESPQVSQRVTADPTSNPRAASSANQEGGRTRSENSGRPKPSGEDAQRGHDPHCPLRRQDEFQGCYHISAGTSAAGIGEGIIAK